MVDLHNSSSGKRPASIAQLTLVSSSTTDFIPASRAGVSLPPWLYTRLSGVRTAVHLRPQCKLTIVLVAPRTSPDTIGDCAFPATATSVWKSLLESVWVSPSLQAD